VQGEVRVGNEQLDDMVLLRSDGTPTYMLSVVVDDHDMNITHVVRGDDHLTNTFRQKQIYQSMGWDCPSFAHIPLIHGPDGAKLSKRHGALGVEAYRELGYMPAALRNYLLRLGWSHGDEEIISTEQAVSWFDLSAVGRSAARFDYAKLDNLNGHYLRAADDRELALETAARLGITGDEAATERLVRGMAGLKARAKTLKELAESATFYVAERPIPFVEKAKALLTPDATALLKDLLPSLTSLPDWQAATVEAAVRQFIEIKGVKLGQVAQPLRAALTGAATSPGLFEVMEVLGRDESLGRVNDACK
jgi:glutamyl-tRNA synthetase